VDKPMSNSSFKMMALILKLRDLLRPRQEVMNEVGIEPGFRVLDFGCGPGGYIAAAAALVGKSGMVYALDIHPLAIQSVQKIVSKRRLTNVEAICSTCQIGLPDNSLDVVLLYDIFHLLSKPYAILRELHRVLKLNGTLSFSDHHMAEDEIIAGVTNSRLFRLSKTGKKTYSFSKQV